MWYERIKSYYEKGYYTKEQVQLFIPKFITQLQYEDIIS